jgi:serralysin
MADFNGTAGPDVWIGSGANETAHGGGGNDDLQGGGGNDTIYGEADDDTLNGDDGNDTIWGGAGLDHLFGGAGDDVFWAQDADLVAGEDYHGGSGNDALLISTGASAIDLTGLVLDSIELLQAGPLLVSGDPNLAVTMTPAQLNGLDNLYIGIGTLVISAGGTVDFTGGHMQLLVINLNAAGNTLNLSGVIVSNYSPTDGPYINGGAGSDNIFGSNNHDRIYGNDGDDVLNGGLSGSDLLDGGAGNDRLVFTSTFGNDAFYGGSGIDTFDASNATAGVIVTLGLNPGDTGSGPGDDQLHDIENLDGSAFGDTLTGDSGANRLQGLGGNDTLLGEGGDDTLDGGAGDDTLSSVGLVNGVTFEDDMTLNHDVLNGAGGNDMLGAGYGDDVDGGSGSDMLHYSLGGAATGVTFDTAGIVGGQPFAFAGGTINGIESVVYLRGSEFADTFNLATQSDLLTLDAGGGDDVISSHSSSIAVSGGAGNDRFISGSASDTFDGGTGTDTIDYSSYASAVAVSLGLAAGSTGSGAGGDSLKNVEDIDGSDFSDTLNGSDDANVVRGRAGNDTIDGKGGNDTLDGGAGADSMTGGQGNDVFYIDDAGDQVFETAGQGNDAVYTSLSYTLAAGQEIETLAAMDPTANGALDLTGNALSQMISGNAAANLLTSGGGSDYLVGLGGDDVLVGNADAASTLQGGTGNDWYYVSRTGDSVVEAAGEGNDRVLASTSFTLGIGQSVETLNAADPAATTAINLTGNELAQVIAGNAGANILIGGGGADYLVGAGGDDILVGNADAASTLQGGTGNDWYYVSRTGDSLIEFAGEGNDRILTSVSYTLSAGQEIETLSALDPAATTALGLTGNALAQVINGNAGANVLTGGGGNDYLVGLGGNDILVGNADANSTLQGGTGNDWYYVSRTGDSLVEFAGEGNDRILTSVSYTLSAGQEIETLSAADQNGNAAIDLVGNDFAQVIFGTNGANGMSGNGGADQLSGFGGEDVILGGDGDDQLNGGGAHDVLNGGNGADLFVFADTLGGGNVDTIQDFTSGSDRFALDHGVFSGLSTGLLSSSAFVTGTAAQDADDRIIYNQATGELWFDADGNGAGGAVLFATLANQATISAGDFVVI